MSMRVHVCLWAHACLQWAPGRTGEPWGGKQGHSALTWLPKLPRPLCRVGDDLGSAAPGHLVGN